MRTYEELLASYTELAHFNQNHDPRNGQFVSTKYQTSSGDLTKKERKNYAEALLNHITKRQKQWIRSIRE